LKLRLAFSLAMGLCAGVAAADTITTVQVGGNLVLSQSWASTAPGQTNTTVTGTGVNGDGLGVGISDLTGAAGGGTYLFSQSFTSPTGSFAGPGTVNGNPYGFVASYVIDVSPSMANAFVFSLNLSAANGLDDLTARLYEYSANGILNLVLGNVGALSSGALDTWSASSNPSGLNPVASTTLPTTNLTNGGEFVLEIAGLETGTSNGAYSGQLAITPVPLPAALPLLLTSLGGFVLLGRRRRA